ncbi:MAG: glycosyltransferase family 4 protein, partial [Burkholderiales bacterium]|nr:glycosyltransferase family 4 protein [Anaerolineae bacterium]
FGALGQGNRQGITKAVAIVAGLTMTTAGYVRGLIAQRKQSQPAPTSSTELAPFDNGQTSLRVLMVSARYFPLTGGTETHTYEVARRMAADGHQVTVLTTDLSGELAPQEIHAGVTIKRVAAYPRSRDFYFAPAIYSEITSGKWDVVHIQGYHTFVAPIAMFAAWRSKTPYVVTFHSGGHSSSLRNKGRSFQRLLLKPLLERANQLIGVSQFEADFFAQHLGIDRQRFVVIPNGSHLPALDYPVLPEPYPLIVSSGRLERYKGHQHVISAFSKVLEERSDARLRIAGAGPYELELQHLATSLGVQDRVEIQAIPSVNRLGMAELLSRASLVVLFSEYEAHPVAVMEALSLKRPVLVADTSGLSELAQRGLVQALPLESNSDQLAAAILQQLDHPLIPADVTLPTWDGCAAQLLEVYRYVLRRAH